MKGCEEVCRSIITLCFREYIMLNWPNMVRSLVLPAKVFVLLSLSLLLFKSTGVPLASLSPLPACFPDTRFLISVILIPLVFLLSFNFTFLACSVRTASYAVRYSKANSLITRQNSSGGMNLGSRLNII